MMKKNITLLLAIALVSGVLSGCGGTASSSSSSSSTSSASGSSNSSSDKAITITCFQNSPEYTDAFNAYIDEYKKVKPNVKIDLEITQADYPTLLKAKTASNNIPDVFASTAGGEIKAYAEYSADLTNEPLAKAMTDAVKT